MNLTKEYPCKCLDCGYEEDVQLLRIKFYVHMRKQPIPCWDCGYITKIGWGRMFPVSDDYQDDL